MSKNPLPMVGAGRGVASSMDRASVGAGRGQGGEGRELGALTSAGLQLVLGSQMKLLLV